MPDRTCSLPDCGKPYRARGLCSTHYNRKYQPLRHAPQVASCTVCGATILRPFTGGEHSMANARTACLSCNSAKKDQEVSHVA